MQCTTNKHLQLSLCGSSNIFSLTQFSAGSRFSVAYSPSFGWWHNCRLRKTTSSSASSPPSQFLLHLPKRRLRLTLSLVSAATTHHHRHRMARREKADYKSHLLYCSPPRLAWLALLSLSSWKMRGRVSALDTYYILACSLPPQRRPSLFPRRWRGCQKKAVPFFDQTSWAK